MRVEGVPHNWEASLLCNAPTVSKRVVSNPPSLRALKFNVDGAAKGKSGPAGIGGVLCNGDGVFMLMFSKHVGCMESIEA